MATSNTAPTLPIFREGAKVKLATNTSMVGRLRTGNDLETVLPEHPGDIIHTAAEGHIFTIHTRENAPTSMAPGYGPGNPDPLGYRYRLKLHTNESRVVQITTAKVKTNMAHTNLRPNGSLAGSKPSKTRFFEGDFAMLMKAMPLQPMGAVSPKQYPAGQLIKIVSEAKSMKGKDADENTPVSLCKYEIAVVETKVYKDVYWKSKYPVDVYALAPAN